MAEDEAGSRLTKGARTMRRKNAKISNAVIRRLPRYRRYLIELALGSERALFSALDLGRQHPTVRFSQDLSAILAQFRALEPFQYNKLGRPQETCGIP